MKPAAAPGELLLSVVVPAHNASRTIERTLAAIAGARNSSMVLELIVVDDGSSDDTSKLAEVYADRVVRRASSAGSAVARNAGAATARGEYLLFVDADVVPTSSAIPYLIEALSQGSDCVIGRYGRDCLAPQFGSRFKNAIHHAMFARSPTEISWFWTGFGALRRSQFERAGGFDESLFTSGAGLEDVDLGVRLTRNRVSIRLDKRIVVHHNHPRGVWAVLENDFVRSAQQSLLAVRRGHYRDEAFATVRNFLRAATLDVALVSGAAALVWAWAWPLSISAMLAFCTVSRPEHHSFAGLGRWFAARASMLDACSLVAAQLGGAVGVVRGISTRQSI